MLTKSQLAKLRAERVGPSRNRVGAAMKLVGMTQVELGEAIGQTQPQVSAVVSGRHGTVMLTRAQMYAQYFGCSTDDLFPAA